MKLKDLLQGISKAQLQGYYLYWFPGREIFSIRERLSADLEEVLTDHARVRVRFDALPRSQQGFVISLLLRDGYSGTVADVRAQKHGKIIEDFEVEQILKSLQEAGYIVKTGGTGGYASEVFGIPEELAMALRRTIAVDERHPMEMLSLFAARNRETEGQAEEPGIPCSDELEQRIGALTDDELRRSTRTAIAEYFGIFTHSAAAGARLARPEWRRDLEEARLGTTGVLSLKDYGIDLEEEALIVYQEIAYEVGIAEAQKGPWDHDREISLGADLIIDIDRALEVLRSEPLEVTREGNFYKKIEERIAGHFVTAQYPEFHEGSPVSHILELCRRLHFFDEEGQRMTLDPLRRRVWSKKPLLRKADQIFELYRNENRGQRWSFHQTSVRGIFLDHLCRIRPGDWLVARHILSAVINHYLLSLEKAQVASAFHERCTGDFRHETLVVPLQKLYRDLSYWVVHRLALLGLVDIGYREGVFHALRLSRLGMRYFEVKNNGGGDFAQAAGAATAPAEATARALTEKAVYSPENSRILVNPDFEILLYPEAPDEASWLISFFADRVDSDRVKRYRLSRESLKRGIVAGLTREEIVNFLEANVHGGIPPNVFFSLREWTDGVEVIRRQKVTLLRASTAGGAERLSEILERQEVPHERLNETTVVVRGGRHERAIEELQQQLRDNGLFVE